MLSKVVEGLHDKPLTILGDPGCGKTVFIKALTAEARRQFEPSLVLKVFEPALAWWHSAPLMFRQEVNDYKLDYNRVRNLSHCLYELGTLSKPRRRAYLESIIKSDYVKRYGLKLVNESFIKSAPWCIYVVEESQTIFSKYGQLDPFLDDYVSFGRNLNMTGVYSSQRPAEMRTDILERCNMVCGYIGGDNSRKKLKNAVSKTFMEQVKQLSSGEHEFIYYDGEISEVFTVNMEKYEAPTLI